jgi:hypothetical protein
MREIEVAVAYVRSRGTHAVVRKAREGREEERWTDEISRWGGSDGGEGGWDGV